MRIVATALAALFVTTQLFAQAGIRSHPFHSEVDSSSLAKLIRPALLPAGSSIVFAPTPSKGVGRFDSTSASRGHHVAKGALIGFLLGGAVGATAGSFAATGCPDIEPNNCSRPAGHLGTIVYAGLVVGGIGAAIGALIGTALPTDPTK